MALFSEMMDQVSQLHAEVERLMKEYDAALGNADINYQKWVEAQAEIERLRAVLQAIADHSIGSIVYPGETPEGADLRVIKNIAREALANEQNARDSK